MALDKPLFWDSALGKPTTVLGTYVAAQTASKPANVRSADYLTTASTGATGSGTYTTLGQLVMSPLDVGPAAQTFSGLGTNISTAAAGGTTPLVRMGLYPDDGTGLKPAYTTPIAGSGVSFDPTGATGDKYVAFGTPLTLQPGRYWAAFLLVSGSALTTPPTVTTLPPLANIGLTVLGNNSHRGWAFTTTTDAAALPALTSSLFHAGGNWPIIGMKAV